MGSQKTQRFINDTIRLAKIEGVKNLVVIFADENSGGVAFNMEGAGAGTLASLTLTMARAFEQSDVLKEICEQALEVHKKTSL